MHNCNLGRKSRIEKAGLSYMKEGGVEGRKKKRLLDLSKAVSSVTATGDSGVVCSQLKHMTFTGRA